MALLLPPAFATKWTRLLADNVFQEIDGPRLAELIADISDSFATNESGVNVPDWRPNTYYPLGFVILYSGTNRFYKAIKAGYLDEPSDAAGDENWEATLSPAGDGALYQVGTVAALRTARGHWVPNRLYILRGRQDPATGAPLDDVYVRAISGVQLEPEGYIIDNSSLAAVPVRVSYDLDTDETGEVQSGGGEPPARLTIASYVATVAGAQPAITIATAARYFNVSVNGDELRAGVDYTDNSAGTLTITRGDIQVGEVIQYCWLTAGGLAAAPVDSYSKTESDTQRQALESELDAIEALVPAKATPTNQLATLADIGQITFVDVPLVLTNGSYAIPKDCAGKRFVISDGTADTFINLRALNNDSVGKVFALTIDNGVRQRLVAYAFGSATGGGAYVELAETALLLAGKSYAGPAGSFYYNAFKIGAPLAVKSVNGVLPDAAGNIVIATGGGSDTYTQLAFQPTPTIDLSLAAQLLTLTNNVGFAGTSNRAQGRQVRVFLFNNTAAALMLTFPSVWNFFGVKPTTMAAGKKGVLTLECVYGSAEGDIVAGYIDQN